MNKKQMAGRILQMIVVLFGISFFTFGLTYLSPGDPAEIMLSECGNIPTEELLEKTREELGLNEPFLVQSFAHQIAVMYVGNVVEIVPGENVSTSAKHPYTQALLDSVFSMVMDPSEEIKVLEGEVPSSLEVLKGCPFASRCQQCEARCREEKPELKQIGEGHFVACHKV